MVISYINCHCFFLLRKLRRLIIKLGRPTLFCEMLETQEKEEEEASALFCKTLHVQKYNRPLCYSCLHLHIPILSLS